MPVFFLLFCAATTAFACECGPWKIAEYEFERHPTVVIAELRSVALIKKKKISIEVSTFTVTRSLKGKYKPGDKISFKRPALQNCIWSFVRDPAGEQFLLYLDRKTRVSGPSTCGRSGRMSNAHPDVERIEEVLAGKSRW